MAGDPAAGVGSVQEHSHPHNGVPAVIPATFQSPRRISTRLQSRLAILTDEIRGTGIPLNLPGTRARRTIAGSRPSPGSPGSQGLGLDLPPAILGILRKSQESRVADPAWDPQEPQQLVIQRPGWEVSASQLCPRAGPNGESEFGGRGPRNAQPRSLLGAMPR